MDKIPGFFSRVSVAEKSVLDARKKRDIVYFSTFKQLHTCNPFRNFSIKYTLVGRTLYKLDKGREFCLKGGLYFLASEQAGECIIDSDGYTQALCIDISQDTIDEAYTVLTARGNFDLDNYRAGYFRHPHFIEQVQNIEGSILQEKLSGILHWMNTNDPGEFLWREWFFDLATKVILHEEKHRHAVNRLGNLKPCTKKEIIQRVAIGKAYIDDMFLMNISIHDVACEATMSDFYFFRSFRLVYDMSPYKYLLSKRLQHAHQLLAEGKLKVKDIGIIVGFSDAYCFSKAYKHYYGQSPVFSRRAVEV
jgi:AraC family transcriptional regulator